MLRKSSEDGSVVFRQHDLLPSERNEPLSVDGRLAVRITGIHFCPFLVECIQQHQGDEGSKTKYGDQQHTRTQIPEKICHRHESEVCTHQDVSDRCMGKTQVEQEMVDMIPIRTEWRFPAEDPQREDPERIKQGYHQNGEANRGRCRQWSGRSG